MKRYAVIALIMLILPYQKPTYLFSQQDNAHEREPIESSQDYPDRKLVRPSPKERIALIKLLEQKPRPKTLIDADIKFLRSLLDKAVWTGAERRILREIWQEVTGRDLGLDADGNTGR